MKKAFLLILMGLLSLTVMARSISYVEKDGTWYRFYDERGDRYKTKSASEMGELVGWSSECAIFKSGSFYRIYDCELNKIKTIAESTCGEIIAVAGETFTSKSGSWIYTYDKYGNRLKTRPAN